MGVLRVQPFRGAQVASGVVVLVTLAVLLELRMAWGDGAHLAVTGACAALVWALVLATPPVPGQPATWLSTLCLGALALLAAALLRAATLLGVDDPLTATGTICWVALVLCVAASALARRRRSPACSLVAGLAGVTTLVAGADGLLDASSGVQRWLLLLAGTVLALAAVATRDREPLHAAQLANAGGAAILAIGVTGTPIQLLLGGADLGWGWELVVLAGAFGLLAYGTVDSQRGPVGVGLAILVAFVLGVAYGPEGAPADALLGWPVVLAAMAAVLLVIGLRPTTPAPPEPEPGGEPGSVIEVRIER